MLSGPSPLCPRDRARCVLGTVLLLSEPSSLCPYRDNKPDVLVTEFVVLSKPCSLCSKSSRGGLEAELVVSLRNRVCCVFDTELVLSIPSSLCFRNELVVISSSLCSRARDLELVVILSSLCSRARCVSSKTSSLCLQNRARCVSGTPTQTTTAELNLSTWTPLAPFDENEERTESLRSVPETDSYPFETRCRCHRRRERGRFECVPESKTTSWVGRGERGQLRRRGRRARRSTRDTTCNTT